MTAIEKLDRLLRLARWALIPYLIGVLFALVGAVLLVGYGLAHASGPSIGAFFLTLAAVGLVAAGLPFFLLTKSTTPFWLTLRLAGLAVMLLAAGVIGRMLWMLVIEPRVMAARYDYLMSTLEPGEVTEQSLMLDGELAGVRVSVSVRVPRDVTLQSDRTHVLEALQSLNVEPVETNLANPLVRIPDEAILTVDDRPLTDLPGWQRDDSPATVWPAADAVLPAGKYRVQADFWFAGVSQLPSDPRPCRLESLDADAWLTQRAAQVGTSVRPVIVASMGLKYRLGYRGYSHRWPALNTRGDAAHWREHFARLSLPRCSELQAQLDADRAAQAAADAERRFATGDVGMPLEDNPLRRAICAGDEINTRRLLTLPGAKRSPLGAILADCAINTPRPDLLRLVLPELLAREDHDDAYCQVIVAVHQHHQVELARLLLAEGLSLDCPGRDTPAWRLPFELRDNNGELVPVTWDESTQAWLEFLIQQGIKVCAPHFGDSLLARAVLDAPEGTLQVLLDNGCDPHEPGFNARLASLSEDMPSLNPAVRLWPLRRFAAGRHGIAPLDDAAIARLNRQLDGVTPIELEVSNGPRSDLIYRLRGLALQEPALVHYLLAKGQNISHAAGETCQTWFTPGYEPSDPKATTLPEVALLDTFSDAQLAELIKPWSMYCTAVEPMPEVRNFAPNALGTYLCRRGVVACGASITLK